jgi:hypothetical protein
MHIARPAHGCAVHCYSVAVLRDLTGPGPSDIPIERQSGFELIVEPGSARDRHRHPEFLLVRTNEVMP